MSEQPWQKMKIAPRDGSWIEARWDDYPSTPEMEVFWQEHNGWCRRNKPTEENYQCDWWPVNTPDMWRPLTEGRNALLRERDRLRDLRLKITEAARRLAELCGTVEQIINANPKLCHS